MNLFCFFICKDSYDLYVFLFTEKNFYPPVPPFVIHTPCHSCITRFILIFKFCCNFTVKLIPNPFSKMLNETAALRKIFAPLFESALLKEMVEKSILFTAKAGQILITMGQNINVVPVVLEGTLKISRMNEEGQELLLYYVREGEGCAMTFSCGMMSQVSQVQGCAEEDLTMLCVPVPVMDEWMVKYPSWKQFVMSTIVDEFMDVIKSVDDVAFKKMDERLAAYLKEKSKITGSSLINHTHQQIADEMGTNRVVISRLLKKLETDGKLLLYRNQIKLLKEL
jgi:CRP/FNR family transcriptional regulator, anaerobic regulatory protein